MPKKARRYSFDPDILRLRLTNWERIRNTQLKIDTDRLRLGKIAELEARIAAIETQLRPPKLRANSVAHLADRLRTKWFAK